MKGLRFIAVLMMMWICQVALAAETKPAVAPAAAPSTTHPPATLPPLPPLPALPPLSPTPSPTTPAATPAAAPATPPASVKPGVATPATPAPAPSTPEKKPEVPKKDETPKKPAAPPEPKAEVDLAVNVDASGEVCKCTNDDLKNCTEGVGDYLCAPYYGAHCQKEIAACIKQFDAPRENLAQVCACHKVRERCQTPCNAPMGVNTCPAGAQPTLSAKTCIDYAISPCQVPTWSTGVDESLCAACCASAEKFDQLPITPPYWSCLANPKYNKTRHDFDQCVRVPLALSASDD